jgi:hypothetical protein
MALLRIREAEPLEGFKLRLTMTDGSTIEREVSRLLAGPVFEKIRRDPALFAEVQSRAERWYDRTAPISARTLSFGAGPHRKRDSNRPIRRRREASARWQRASTRFR